MIGRRILETVLLSAAQTPSTTPIDTAKTVATSTCESVSIARAHTPSTPIEASITSVVTAGRRPLTTSAISASPATVTNQGVSTRKSWIGSSAVREDVVADRLGDAEHPRRRVLHVVQHRLDLGEHPLLTRRVCSPPGVVSG